MGDVWAEGEHYGCYTQSTLWEHYMTYFTIPSHRNRPQVNAWIIYPFVQLYTSFFFVVQWWEVVSHIIIMVDGCSEDSCGKRHHNWRKNWDKKTSINHHEGRCRNNMTHKLMLYFSIVVQIAQVAISIW